jgi:hypothetical protein
VNVWSHIMGVLFFLGIMAWTIICLNPISTYYDNNFNSTTTSNPINSAFYTNN